MRSEKLTIIIVGSGLSLSMCAAYLAEKLQYLKPVIIGVLLPQEERESDLAFAFPPFAEPLVPIIRNQLAEASLDKVSIFSAASPGGFAFNFAPYGVASGFVTFPHAYEIYRQHSADLPSYDSFLGVQPPSSRGILYSRMSVTPGFHHTAVRKRLVFVPSKSVSVTLSEDREKILAIKTSNGQVLTGDYFIDCSSNSVVMQNLQEKISISEKTIPSWSLARSESIVTNTNAVYQLKFDQEQVDCLGELDGKCYLKTYDFGGDVQSGEYFEQPWLGNCVALGQGFARIPELLIDLDRLLERQLATLSWLLGVNRDTTYAARHFNKLSIRHVNEAIDAVNLLLQSLLTNRPALTESNRRRANIFLSSANTVKEDNLLISENCWTGLLHAGGFVPQNTNAVSMAIDPKRIIDLTKSLFVR